MAALTLTLNDNSGVTDAGVVRGLNATINDQAKPSDTSEGVPKIDRGVTVILLETMTMTDAGASQAVTESITDTAGLTDSRTLATSGGGAQTFAITIDNAAGLSDLVSIVGGSAPVPPEVPVVAGLPQVIIEIGFDLPTVGGNDFILDDPVRGQLDSGALSSGQIWVDVSDWLMSYTLSRGARSGGAEPEMRYEAGTLTVELLNDDRRFDPTNLSGPYVNLGVTQVRPRRPIRVRAIWQGSEYHRFRGFVDAWADEGGSPVHSVTTVTATDGFKVLSSDRGEPAFNLGAGETTGARVNRVLDSVGWPSSLRRVSTGDTAVQATALSGDALAELQLVADTEIGDLYMSTQGEVVFRNRQAIQDEPASNTSQATFGSVYPELPYVTVTREYSDGTLINQAVIAREGGVEQTVTDSASVSEYLLHSYARSDLLYTTDEQALSHAGWVVGMSKDPEYRFTDLEVDPRADPVRLFPQVLGRDFADRITVIRRPPGGGAPITQDTHIRGVEESYGQGRWHTQWTLQSAFKYSIFKLDNPTLGQLDNNRLGF